jgi:hypothetical protein
MFTKLLCKNLLVTWVVFWLLGIAHGALLAIVQMGEPKSS